MSAPSLHLPLMSDLWQSAEIVPAPGTFNAPSDTKAAKPVKAVDTHKLSHLCWAGAAVCAISAIVLSRR